MSMYLFDILFFFSPTLTLSISLTLSLFAPNICGLQMVTALIGLLLIGHSVVKLLSHGHLVNGITM